MAWLAHPTPSPERADMAGMPRLEGLCLSVADSNAALAWLLPRLPVQAAPDEAGRGPRVVLRGGWLELQTQGRDLLRLQGAGLAAQRTHLKRLGIEPVKDIAPGAAPRMLRLDPMDTGGCAIELSEPPLPFAAVAPARGAAIGAIEFEVRSPERVASHWSQILRCDPQRSSSGLPALRLGEVEFRFRLAGDGRARIHAIDFAVHAAIDPATSGHASALSLATGEQRVRWKPDRVD